MKYSLFELWNMSGDFSLLESILIGTFFLSCDFCLCIVNWYLQQEAIIELGYPKRKSKTMKKRMKRFRFWERITLTRLCKESERKRVSLWFYWCLNFLNILVAGAGLVGYCGMVITGGAGWSMVLLIIGPFGVLILSMLLRFIPDLLFLPSERRRYFCKKK